MGRYIGPKTKICKRIGVNIYGNPKYDAIIAKYTANKKLLKKPSEYALQLKEKQLARYIYNISEKQFQKYFNKAYRLQGVTGMEMLKLLERRIDNVLFRSGLATTRLQARQMISHGHFEYNGHKVNIPSLTVRENDVITLRKGMHTSPLYVGFDKLDPTKWIKIDPKNKAIIITRLPEDDELERIINMQLIVEYYSR